MKEPGGRSYRRRAPPPFPWDALGPGTRSRVARLARSVLAAGPLGTPSSCWTLLQPSKRRFPSVPRGIVGDRECMSGGRAPLLRLGVSSAEILPFSSFVLQGVSGAGDLGMGHVLPIPGQPQLSRNVGLEKKHPAAWAERTPARAALPTPFPEGYRVRGLPQRLPGLCPFAASGPLLTFLPCVLAFTLQGWGKEAYPACRGYPRTVTIGSLCVVPLYPHAVAPTDALF